MKIIVIGATSAIAEACARLWAAEGAELFLVARNAARQEAVAGDLRLRGARAVHCHILDVNDVSAHEAMLASAVTALGGLDIAFIAHGTLPDQEACQADTARALSEFMTNGSSVIALLNGFAGYFERQGKGFIGVITSVAGDRGRPSNYLYGSAKAAVSTYCEGLRSRLFKIGVSVTDIRPGFVDTPMTRGLSLPPMLISRPDTVARKILDGIAAKKGVLYVPGYWALIMFIVRNIPRCVFNRLTL